MGTVNYNGKLIDVQGSVKMYVFKMALTGKANIRWIDANNVVVTDDVTINRPLSKLSSDIRTMIKEG